MTGESNNGDDAPQNHLAWLCVYGDIWQLQASEISTWRIVLIMAIRFVVYFGVIAGIRLYPMQLAGVLVAWREKILCHGRTAKDWVLGLFVPAAFLVACFMGVGWQLWAAPVLEGRTTWKREVLKMLIVCGFQLNAFFAVGLPQPAKRRWGSWARSTLFFWKKRRSPFQVWLDTANGGLPTTLEQQMELAVRLWHEANKVKHSCNQDSRARAKEVLQELDGLVRTPLVQGEEEQSLSYVSWKGFHVGWFLNVFCKTPFMQKLLEYGCELWFVRKVCIIQIILEAHCRCNNKTQAISVSGPFVDFMDMIATGIDLASDCTPNNLLLKSPTTFISYTGRYTLEQTLKALNQLDEDEYIWMDIFCVNQFAWTGKSRTPQMKQFKEGFLDELERQIRAIGRTALILEKWDDIMRTLEQIWVLWEIFNTAEAGTELDVLLPPEQSQDFVDNCLESSIRIGDIMASLASVDATNAKAENDYERTRIFARIQESGVTEVNNIVTRAMRGWMLEQGLGQGNQMADAQPAFLNNFAFFLTERGMPTEAEPLHREALAGYQAVLGPDHPDTLMFSVNLATCLCRQGKHKSAEPLYRLSLEKYEKVVGPEHPGTLTCKHNLAKLMLDQGKLKEAEHMYRDNLEKCERVFGADHRNTLSSVNDLAVVLQTQGKLEEAEHLYRQALEKKRQVLGVNHPCTQVSLANLAGLLQSQGSLAEADALFRQVVEKQQRVLGPDHPETLTSLNSLAVLLQDQGNLEEAEPLFQELLEKRQRVLGPNHPDTLTSLNSLAVLLQDQGKLEAAEPLLQKVLEIHQNMLGHDHPDTLAALNNLFRVREVLEKSQYIQGRNHPDTQTSLNNPALSSLVETAPLTTPTQSFGWFRPWRRKRGQRGRKPKTHLISKS